MAKNIFIRFIVFSASMMVLLVCNSCGVPEPKKVSFNGQWKMTSESIVSKEENIVTVSTDGDRFRIEDEASISVYDGTHLYTKTKSTFLKDYSWMNESLLETQQREISKAEAGQLKFWLNFYGEKAGPGGNIAGQETVLYQIKDVRPDGEIAVQNWVDAKTDIVLKSVQTIYARQIGEILTKNAKECLQINYVPVEENIFSKPE